MATITREQAMKRQEQAPQGWRYDWKHFVVWNENQLTRTIEQDDGSLIKVLVAWRENYDKHTNEFGCSWRTPSGTYSPELHVSRWVQGSTPDVWTSHGLGKGELLSTERHGRKVYKDLCKYAATVTDEQILAIWNAGAELQLAL